MIGSVPLWLCPLSCVSAAVLKLWRASLQVDFGVDLDSRVALVGPNGAGKSTLLKLMVGTLEPLDGMVKRHNHLKIGQYHQHLTELLDPELTPLEYMVGALVISKRLNGQLQHSMCSSVSAGCLASCNESADQSKAQCLSRCFFPAAPVRCDMSA